MKYAKLCKVFDSYYSKLLHIHVNAFQGLTRIDVRLTLGHIKLFLCEEGMESVYQSQARVFKALCDETRLRVLEMLRGGEKCACKLLENLDCGQSGLSYHMKVLLESGIVTSRQEGKWTYYRICPEGAPAAISLIQELTTVTSDSVQCDCCEN